MQTSFAMKGSMNHSAFCATIGFMITARLTWIAIAQMTMMMMIIFFYAPKTKNKKKNGKTSAADIAALHSTIYTCTV